MPVHAVSGGFRWGSSGKVYRSHASAERQARAIYASGYRQDKARLALHKALSASRRTETAYVLALVGILGAVHRGVLQVVHREHLNLPAAEGNFRSDDEPPRIGLKDALLKRLVRFVTPQVVRSFDSMADDAEDTSAEGISLVGIRPRSTPGLAKVISRARDENVKLITQASEDFLAQIRDTLDEHEGDRPEEIAAALQERVDVSKSRAVLIARDQTTKLHAALNRHRQTDAGVKSYRWSTSHDERVRPSHAELDGERFPWDDPPIVDDEPANPGEPIQCRCIALPVIEELEQAEEEPETEEGEVEEPDYDVAAE